jgi:hypothetical protein
VDSDQDDPQDETRNQPVRAPTEAQHGAERLDAAVDQPSMSEKILADRINRSDRWMIVLTAAIAFSGIISAVIFGKQLLAMEAQLTEMRIAREGSDKSTADQIALMTAQSDTMAGQLSQMKAAAEQTERAIIATNHLAEEAGRSADQSRRLADAAIAENAVTRQLATAADRANQINRKSLTGVQRAFISVKSVEYEPWDPNDKSTRYDQWFVDVALENSGNTPAADLHIRTRCSGSVTRVTDPYTIPGLGPSVGSKNSRLGDLRTLELGPKQAKPVARCPMAGDFRAQNGQFFYVFGTAAYRDTLDSSSAHLTEFCFEAYRLDGPEGAFTSHFDPHLRERDLIPCRTHNCTDDGCGKADLQLAVEDLTPSPPTGATAAPRPLRRVVVSP